MGVKKGFLKKDLQNLTRKEIRKAIVLSEVLGKPKAQQKRPIC